MDDITFVQSRAKMALVLLSFLVLAAGGAWMIEYPYGSTRHSPEYIRAAGALVVATSGLLVLFAAAQLLRPSRLILNQGGLTYVWLWRRRTWPWRDLGPFTIEEERYVVRIRFDVAPGSAVLFPFGQNGSQTLPDAWTSDIKQVCAALDTARDRWR